MTKDKAEEEAKRLDAEMGNKICPLLDKECVTHNCVSYYKARVLERRGDCDIYPPMCNNALNDIYALAGVIGEEINRNLN